MDDYTRKFNAAEDKDQQVHYILTTVYESLKEKGYDPINQIVGYILSEDPTAHSRRSAHTCGGYAGEKVRRGRGRYDLGFAQLR